MREEGVSQAKHSLETNSLKRFRETDIVEIQRKIVKWGSRGQFDRLDSRLSRFGVDENEINEFLRQYGVKLLKQSLLMNNGSLLEYLTLKIAPEVGYDLLSKNDFEVLVAFSKSGKIFYILNPSDVLEPGRVDKLKGLIRISKQAVDEFLEAHKDQNYVTDLLLKEYQEASELADLGLSKSSLSF